MSAPEVPQRRGPSRSAPEGSDAQRFTALWEATAHRVQAYAMRHVDPDTAQEVVAETYLVAWRRLQDVPGDPLPWLIVVARNTISNDRRSRYRARTLEVELQRLASVSPVGESAPESEIVERDLMLRGLAQLTAKEREALLLLAWDGLAPADAAMVAGCTTTAFHVRVHRARRRLAAAVDEPGRVASAATHATGGAPPRADGRPPADRNLQDEPSRRTR